MHNFVAKAWHRVYSVITGNTCRFERLRLPDKSQASDIESIAIAISCRSDNHSAILYSASDGIRKIHYSGHVQCEEALDVSDLGWAHPIELLPEQVTQLLSLCDLIHDQCSRLRVPYRFAFSHQTRFDTGGPLLSFIPGSGTTGLTCATFVVTLFYQCGIPLVDFSSWTSREEDVAFQRELVKRVTNHNRDAASQMALEIGAHRIRPEEVLAAALFTRHPVNFWLCESAGTTVVARIREYYARAGIA